MITVRRADIPFTRDGVEGSYPEILFSFDDDTILRAHDANGRWIITGGNGWEHVRQLVDARWVTTIDGGPATYGHTTYRVADSICTSLAGFVGQPFEADTVGNLVPATRPQEAPALRTYRYTYEVTETRTATVEAESESAARQHWIECADDIDANGSELVETVGLTLVDVDEVG